MNTMIENRLSGQPGSAVAPSSKTLTQLQDEIIESANVRLVGLAPTTTDQQGKATQVQLAQPVGPGRIADFLAHNGEGLQHICFEVDDTAAGVRLLGEDDSAVFVGGAGRPMCFLMERPNGVLVELAQPLAAV